MAFFIAEFEQSSKNQEDRRLPFVNTYPSSRLLTL